MDKSEGRDTLHDPLHCPALTPSQTQSVCNMDSVLLTVRTRFTQNFSLLESGWKRVAQGVAIIDAVMRCVRFP